MKTTSLQTPKHSVRGLPKIPTIYRFHFRKSSSVLQNSFLSLALLICCLGVSTLHAQTTFEPTDLSDAGFQYTVNAYGGVDITLSNSMQRVLVHYLTRFRKPNTTHSYWFGTSNSGLKYQIKQTQIANVTNNFMDIWTVNAVPKKGATDLSFNRTMYRNPYVIAVLDNIVNWSNATVGVDFENIAQLDPKSLYYVNGGQSNWTTVTSASINGQGVPFDNTDSTNTVYGEQTYPQAPITYAVFTNGTSPGMLARDDVYRNQATTYGGVTNSAIRDYHFGLGPYASYTTRCEIYPRNTANFYDVVNTYRWLSGLTGRVG